MRLALAFLGFLFAVPALAHMAKSGWAYDADCCSDRDCAEQPDEMFEEVPGGWLIKPSGVVVPHNSVTYPKDKMSKDEHFHLCTGADMLGHGAGDPASKSVYCLYRPPFGS
jgi:hypothetical protein